MKILQVMMLTGILAACASKPVTAQLCAAQPAQRGLAEAPGKKCQHKISGTLSISDKSLLIDDPRPIGDQ